MTAFAPEPQSKPSPFKTTAINGTPHITDPVELVRFFDAVGQHTQFEITFSAKFCEKHFLNPPQFIGFVHIYDPERQELNFRYDGGDPDFFEHLVVPLAEIVGVRFDWARLQKGRCDWSNAPILL